jgi:DNA (cytosine-5)-methyltransferase 1
LIQSRRSFSARPKQKTNGNEDDNALLGRVLEIYGQKYVAEQLRKLGQNEWSRERLNRRVNGKGTLRPYRR